jgi:hypothetical protein
VKIDEYLTSYEKLLDGIEKLLEEDKYADVMGLISEIDHIIALIDEEVKGLTKEQKDTIKPRAMKIIKRQESILASIDENVKSIQGNLEMIPKLQRAAKTYGKNSQV